MFGIGEIASVIGKGLDKFIPDANVREEVALQSAKLVHAELELEVSDRASARAREMAVRDFIPGVLALGMTVGFFGTLIYMMNWPIPHDSERVLDVMLGFMGNAWMMAMAYYFGTSLGSVRKTEIMAGGKPK